MGSHTSSSEYLKNNKTLKGKKMIIGIALILTCVMISAIGQIVLKKGLMQVGGLTVKNVLSSHIFSVIFNPLIFTGIALYGVSMILWLMALSIFDVSFAYPLISLGYIVSAFLAMTFLSEKIPAIRWVGIGMIIAGCFFISRS